MWLFPLAAAATSGLFSWRLFSSFARNGRAPLLWWGLAMVLFALASAAAALGMIAGWSPLWFRIYYLCGAILNVPVLALGTIYLLAPRAVAHASAVVVLGAAAVATIVLFGADVRVAGLETAGIPFARDVLTLDVRNLSRVYSYAGFGVVVSGALWSAMRFARQRGPLARSLTVGNALIAAGTAVVAAASGFARLGNGSVEGTIFSVGLLVGVVMMFAGFLRTSGIARSLSE